jgi:hypothetical protein
MTIIIVILIVIFLLYYNLNCKEQFAGVERKSTDLNTNLKKIVNNLHKYKIKNWYIAYGTLLGIIRNGNCIDNDDDIDIIIEESELSKLHELREKEGYKYENGCCNYKNFVRIVGNNNIPIDFYVVQRDNNNYIDTHEKLDWYDVFPIRKKEWNGVNLQLPNNYISKLNTLYIDIYKKFKRGEYKTVHERGVKIIK